MRRLTSTVFLALAACTLVALAAPAQQPPPAAVQPMLPMPTQAQAATGQAPQAAVRYQCAGCGQAVTYASQQGFCYDVGGGCYGSSGGCQGYAASGCQGYSAGTGCQGYEGGGAAVYSTKMTRQDRRAARRGGRGCGG